MEASGRPVAKLMRDVRAVRWLSLSQAAATLTHERERVFLEKIGPHAVRRAALSKRNARRAAISRRKKVKSIRKHPTRGGMAAKRHINPRGRKRRADFSARGVPVARPVHPEKIRPKPREIVRKLWSWLRR
jgi:hypothetical protein